MIWAAWILLVAAVVPSEGTSCEIADSCDSCLQLGPECSWCPDEDWKRPSRCYDARASSVNCQKPESAKSETITVKDTPLSTGGSRNPVLIQPQQGYFFAQHDWLGLSPYFTLKR